MRKILITVGIVLGLTAGSVAVAASASAGPDMHYHGSSYMHYHG